MYRHPCFTRAMNTTVDLECTESFTALVAELTQEAAAAREAGDLHVAEVLEDVVRRMHYVDTWR